MRKAKKGKSPDSRKKAHRSATRKVRADVVDHREAFLAAYELTCRVGPAAKIAGVERQQHYRWLEDPEYAKRFEEARRVVGDRVKDEMYRRAMVGLRRYKFTRSGAPLYFPGTQEPYYEVVLSDDILKMLGKAHFPDEFREVRENRNADDLNLTEEELAERERRLGLEVGPVDASDLEGAS